ncbi:MAG: dihydropteroate synthase [Leptolyngbyaceae cyanobacterium SM1_3_5]|nr:dihydropteroate synthase [Leptolyngbyaceae cyanobacterium SM1_3_5]
MGVLNITPDSFSDGGLYNAPAAALAQAQELVAAGAGILDVGGQSTRPQADTVTAEEEQRRVVPVIAAIRAAGMTVPISIDTTRSIVAQAAIAAGANWVNDISGGTYDPDMLPTVAKLNVPIVLMHLRGTPKTMQQMTEYEDLISEIRKFLEKRVAAAIAAGIDPAQIAIDPGVGFAKTGSQNLEILRRLSDLRFGHPLLVGTSRKSFIGQILNQPDPQKRIWGTAATCCAAIAGGADILRVHDVRELREVCLVADAIWRGDR